MRIFSNNYLNDILKACITLLLVIFTFEQNLLAQECDLIGKWERINNEENTTIVVIFEKNQVNYLFNGEKIFLPDYCENGDEAFFEHNLEKTKIAIDSISNVVLRDNKCGKHEIPLQLKFLDCYSLVIKLPERQKSETFIKTL